MTIMFIKRVDKCRSFSRYGDSGTPISFTCWPGGECFAYKYLFVSVSGYWDLECGRVFKAC